MNDRMTLKFPLRELLFAEEVPLPDDQQGRARQRKLCILARNVSGLEAVLMRNSRGCHMVVGNGGEGAYLCIPGCVYGVYLNSLTDWLRNYEHFPPDSAGSTHPNA